MKKTMKLLAAGMMAAALMTGCGGDSNTAETTTAEEITTVTEETTEFTIKDYSSYVTLGEYKGIPVSPITISDEEIAARIQEYFHDTVQDGDTVNIDYVGYLNGEAFDGGTAEGDSLTIGSGRFIDGFESGLVGVKVGETVDLNLTFPENYTNETMAGQAVVFTVTVNAISNTIAPEYTLENVAANTEYQSLEEYEATVYDEIYAEYNEERMSEVWYKVIENATISGYPQEEVDVYANEMSDYYKQMAQQYGIEFSSFLSTSGYTEETFEEECQNYGKTVMDETMVLYAIASAENMNVTDEEYHTEIDKIVEQTGMEEALIVQYYGGEKYIRESLLFSKVIEYLIELAVEQ